MRVLESEQNVAYKRLLVPTDSKDRSCWSRPYHGNPAPEDE